MSIGRVIVLAMALATANTIPAPGQLHPIRSVEYSSVAGVSDVRSTWVNPAGLSAIPEASVLGELTLGRGMANSFRVEQFALGFNSRGVSVTYLRNRFENGAPSTTMLRVATGVPIDNGAFGFAVTLYGSPGDNARALDTGFMYSLSPNLTLAAVGRNIGRPTVGSVSLPLVFQGGGLLSLGGGLFQLSADGVATELPGGGVRDYLLSYKAGGSLTLPLRRAVRVLATADFASNIRIDRLHLGLAIGGRSHVMGIGTMVSRNGKPTLDRLSLGGVSSNLLVAR